MSKPTLRRSPRKQSQKSADVATDEQPPGMTVTFVGNTIITYHIPVDVPESEANKPATSKTLRSRPQSRICSNIRISIKLIYCSRKGQGSSEKYIKTQGPEGNFSP